MLARWSIETASSLGFVTRWNLDLGAASVSSVTGSASSGLDSVAVKLDSAYS